MRINKIIMQLISEDFKSKIKEFDGKKGIYKIYSINKNIPCQIRRLAKEDASGLLYIGSSKNLKDRLGMLRRVTIGESDGYKADAHTFGVKYNATEKIKELFPLETLFIEVECKEKFKETESKLLEKYLNDYAELPPLNSNYPKQKITT
jgi:hypothetical protein